MRKTAVMSELQSKASEGGEVGAGVEGRGGEAKSRREGGGGMTREAVLYMWGSGDRPRTGG